MKLSGIQAFELHTVKLSNVTDLNENFSNSQDVNSAIQRWSDSKDKYALWLWASHLAKEIRIQNHDNPTSVLEFFRDLAAASALPWSQRHQGIHQAEVRAFGKALTMAEQPARRQAFWRYVQLALEDKTGPSHFLEGHSPEQCAVLELEGIADMVRKYGNAPAGGYPGPIMDDYIQSRELLRRGPFAHNPQYSQEKMDGIRNWALLHLTKYTEDHYCKVGHYRTYNVYLSMPERRENLPKDWEELGYKPLSYWRRYGIRCLQDMELFEVVGGQELPVMDYATPKFTDDVASRRKRAHQNKVVAQEYFDSWPMAFRPRIPLVAERLNLDLGSRELTHEDINAVEVQFFEKVVTKGDVYSRTKIWLRIYKAYRAWMGKMTHSEDAMMYEQEVLISGIGWIMLGYSPDSRAPLMEFGRGGLHRPSPSNWFAGTADGIPSMFHSQGHDPARFIPLFQWVNNMNWAQLPRKKTNHSPVI